LAELPRQRRVVRGEPGGAAEVLDRAVEVALLGGDRAAERRAAGVGRAARRGVAARQPVARAVGVAAVEGPQPGGVARFHGVAGALKADAGGAIGLAHRPPLILHPLAAYSASSGLAPPARSLHPRRRRGSCLARTGVRSAAARLVLIGQWRH